MAESIFISYCDDDAEWSETFYADLSRRVRKRTVYFFPPETVTPGTHIPTLVSSALKDSGIYLVIVSRFSAISQWVKREVNEAMALQKVDASRRIIPIHITRNAALSASIHPNLGDYHSADFSKPENYLHALHDLVYAIEHARVWREPWWRRSIRTTGTVLSRILFGG